MLSETAKVQRGEVERMKEVPGKTFHQAMQWLISEAERTTSRQRYKGLGEMNAEQLWEITMNTVLRTLRQVTSENAAECDRVFSTLMGDEVALRREYSEKNVRYARRDI